MAGELITLSPGRARRLERMLRWFETRGEDGSPGAPITGSEPDLTIPVYNWTGGWVPRGALVRLGSAYTDLISLTFAQFDYPVVSLGIIASDLPNNASGRAFVPSAYRFYSLLIQTIASVTVGDRVGPQPGQWGADKDYMGDFIVRSKIDLELTTTAGTSGIALCEYLPVDAPPLLITTDDCYDGQITAKQVDESCAATGDNRTFVVCECAGSTTVAPTTTTAPPATTTEGPTTEPASTTTQEPTTTSEGDTTTEEASSTTEPASTTTEGPTTTEPWDFCCEQCLFGKGPPDPTRTVACSVKCPGATGNCTYSDPVYCWPNCDQVDCGGTVGNPTDDFYWTFNSQNCVS